VRHGEIGFEMYHLARAGMSNLAVIGAATRVAAHCLGLGDRIGQVRAGYEADLILVEGDPTLDLAVLQQQACIKLVMRGGRVAVDRHW
jgi:imidazolonepropionase-like amidohydrolase